MPSFFHRDSSRPDSHGRFHISCDEMAEQFEYFHQQLTETYWKSQANQKICRDAMETIKKTHISKKTGRFLSNFTALVREVYSHAHYNVEELLFEERNEVRLTYWKEITTLYDVILKKVSHVWAHSCADKMAVLLQFASLFTLYKDVADQEFIVTLYQLAADWMHEPLNRQTSEEAEQLYDYFDQIQLAYRLRFEHRRHSTIASMPMTSLAKADRRPAPELKLLQHERFEGAVTEHRRSLQATKEDLDDFFNRIQKEHQKEKRMKRTRASTHTPTGRKVSTIKESPMAEDDLYLPAPSIVIHEPEGEEEKRDEEKEKEKEEEKEEGKEEEEEEELEKEVEEIFEVKITKPPQSPKTSPLPFLPDLTNKLRDRREAIERQMSEVSISENAETQQELRCSVKKETESKPSSNGHVEPTTFDFRAEFERRANRRKNGEAAPVVLDLPVIPKPNKLDRVSSYRWRGLYNEPHTTPKRRPASVSINSSDIDRIMTMGESEKPVVPAPCSKSTREIIHAVELRLSEETDDLDAPPSLPPPPPPKPPRASGEKRESFAEEGADSQTESPSTQERPYRESLQL